MLGRVPATHQYGDIALHAENETAPGIVRVESGLFFANADGVRALKELAHPDEVRAVVLAVETTPFIDVTAANILVELAEDMRRNGKIFVIAGEIRQVREVLTETAQPAAFASIRAALEALQTEPPAPPTGDAPDGLNGPYLDDHGTPNQATMDE